MALEDMREGRLCATRGCGHPGAQHAGTRGAPLSVGLDAGCGCTAFTDPEQLDSFEERSLLMLRLLPDGRLEVQGDHDDGRGLVLALWHGPAGTMVRLDREKVDQLHETLEDWLVATEPDPIVPGRPE
jgi:hypothetical protein